MNEHREWKLNGTDKESTKMNGKSLFECDFLFYVPI